MLILQKNAHFITLYFHRPLSNFRYVIDMHSNSFIQGLDDAYKGKVYCPQYHEWPESHQVRYEAGRQYYFEFLAEKMKDDGPTI